MNKIILIAFLFISIYSFSQSKQGILNSVAYRYDIDSEYDDVAINQILNTTKCLVENIILIIKK